MTTTIIEPVQIVEIAETVWSSFLGMDVYELEPSGPLEPSTAQTATATIHITGTTNVSVVLSCSATMAHRAAAAMFDLDEAELTDEEVADAFGEIVNIVGGNLKCLLPEPSELSLPTVTQGAGIVVSIPGAHLLERVDLGCEGERVGITLWGGGPAATEHHHADTTRSTR